MALTKINTNLIANNTIAVTNIADNAVDATKIASNSILTRHIDDDQVTGDQLADNITIAGTLTSTGAITGTLATAAQANITSVGTLSSLAVGAITSTAASTITTADNTAQLTLVSTDTDANQGPILNLNRNPNEAGADNDYLGQIYWSGHNDAGTPEDIVYSKLTSQIVDASDGTEDANMVAYVMKGGSRADMFRLGPTEAVFNESSNDIDFRVESNGNANMLFVDGGNDTVGIGAVSSAAPFQVSASPSDTVGTVGISLKDADNAIEFGLRLDATSKDLHIDRYYSGGWHNNMTFDRSSGNVGIGTASPEEPLHISEGDSGVTPKAGTLLFVENDGAAKISLGSANDNDGQILFGDDGDNDIGAITYSHGGNRMEFKVNASERMRIDSSGNVGIGTTTVNGRLHSEDSTAGNWVGYFNNTGTGGAGVLIKSAGATGSENLLDVRNGSNTLFKVEQNGDAVRIPTDDIWFTLGASNDLGLIHDGSNSYMSNYYGAMYFDQHVNDGNMVFRSDDGSGGVAEYLALDGGSEKVKVAKHLQGATNISSYNGANEWVTIRGLSGGQYIQYGSGDGLSFVAVDTFPNSGASTKMYLNAGGRLLVGSTSELSPTSRVFINANSNSTNPALNLKAATTTSSGSVVIFFAGDGDEVGSVGMSNLEQGTGVSYNTGSDARWKDVTGEAKGLEVITKLNPVAFNWKKSGLADEGLIAQEVQEHVPNIVQEGSNGYLQMDYGKLVTPLIKAVQEQQEQIEELKQQINKLKEEK